ncbi:Putative bystin [Colletotrichum destructivum]|uniref:Bystin n=1 Tax=Colletotrichum destructivum TaxID=34406 RepID=A0AAX4IB70_9PEZI|nr:Putative bystin [Colletotrichum destructivum]
MGKATTPTDRQSRRHNPLQDDILATGPLKNKAPKKKKGKTTDDDDDNGEGFVDATRSRTILRLGRELADEDGTAKPEVAAKPTVDLFGIESRYGVDVGGEEQAYEDEEAWGEEDEIVEEVEIDPEDLETYRKFLPESEDDPAAMLNQHGWGSKGPDDEMAGGGTNLTELILEKIAAHEAAEARKAAGVPVIDEDYQLPPKVIEVYTKIGHILSRYKSGPLPKPFKILPTLPHWEDIIEITEPQKWTPNAVYQATRIFSSSKPLVCQKFMEIVVLDKVREDIYENKKLNVHLFNALKKSLYKPRAFFLGFLFPLLSSGCTVREAHIVSAVLARVSVPVLHSAAALKGITEIAAQEASHGTEGGGAANIFIKTLLEKKYALPYQVIDSVVFHFLRFRSVDPASIKEGQSFSGDMVKSLPVVFHQSLLAFAQRYRNDLSEDQREALLDLLLSHGHHSIAPEIRRELLAGRGKGVAVEQQGAPFDGDDTMLVD